MGSFKECDIRLKGKLELITKAFNNTMCNTETDINGNKIFGFEQDIVKSIPQNGSTFKDNTIYVKGDIISFKGAVYVAKTSSQGQKPYDKFYFREVNPDLKYLGVGFNIRAYISSKVSNTPYVNANGDVVNNMVKVVKYGNSKGVEDDGYSWAPRPLDAKFSIDFFMNGNNLPTFINFMEPSMIRNNVNGNQELIFPHVDSKIQGDSKWALQAGGTFETDKHYAFNAIAIQMNT